AGWLLARGLAGRMFTDFGVADQGREGSVGGQVVALPPIEQAELKEVGAEEAPERPPQQVDQTGLAHPGGPLADEFVAEGNDLLQPCIDGSGAEVVEVALELSDRSVDLQERVRVHTGPASAAASPKSGLPVWIPVAVADPSSAIPGEAGHAERR